MSNRGNRGPTALSYNNSPKEVAQAQNQSEQSLITFQGNGHSK